MCPSPASFPHDISSCHFVTGDLLTRSWGTELLADSSLFRMMVVVGLPEGVVPAADRPPVPEGGGAPQYSYQHAVIVQNMLHHEFKIEVRGLRSCTYCS